MLVRLPIAAFKRTDELTVAQFARLLMLLRVPREPREQLSDSRSPSGVNDSLEEQQFSGAKFVRRLGDVSEQLVQRSFRLFRRKFDLSAERL